MTPKEKAEELYSKLHFVLPSYADEGQQEHQAAKECALIAVDEILNNDVGYNAYDGVIDNDIWIDTGYWQEVKQEIEKL